VAILDDAEARLSDLVSRAPGLDVEHSTFSPETLPGQGSLLQHNLLLINAGIDSHPPGPRLHEVLASTGRKTPTRIFVFADDAFVGGSAGSLVRRGAEAVLPLNDLGLEQLRRQLETLFRLARVWKPVPTASDSRQTIRYNSGLSLAPNQEDLLRLLFVSDADIRVWEAGTGSLSNRQLIVTTRRQRQYFVKLARWDSIAAEYMNYVDLIQGKHENYAGRAIEPPLIRGSEAALRFSLAATRQPVQGRGHGTSRTLGEFLFNATTAQGEQLLQSLKGRLESNLQLEPRPFDPLKFLRVLPPLFTVEDAAFVNGPDANNNDLTFPNRAADSRAAELRRFLDAAQESDSGSTRLRVRINDLGIHEIEPTLSTPGVRVRLTDPGTDVMEPVGYRVDVHLRNRLLVSSLKLRRGRRVSLTGFLGNTLLNQLRAVRPGLDLEGWEQGSLPEERLYDLLLGRFESDKGEWRPSALTALEDTVGGDFTHGDLNLDNILVEERPNERPVPWVIDFETASADFYPVFDWAKLEVEMAMHLTGDAECSVEQLLLHEHSLWCPREFEGMSWVPARSPGQTPSTLLERSMSWENSVRQLAAQGLSSPGFADYLFGVLCYGLRALSFVSTGSGKLRVYIKAAVAGKRIGQIVREGVSETPGFTSAASLRV